MIDRINGIIKLIEEEKTHNEICQVYHLSNQELNEHLEIITRTYGLKYIKIFRSDGNIQYILDRAIFRAKQTYYKSIYTETEENSFKVLVISDLHIGNVKMRPDYLVKAYKYCKANDIHIILSTGDMIDGAFSAGIQTIKKPLEQIEYLLSNLPFDKHILIYGIGGDHDASVKKSYGINLKALINYHRPDIKIANYGNATIRLKNDCISLYHPGFNNEDRKASIQFVGHYHHYFVEQQDERIVVGVPTLSDMNTYGSVPGALDVQFNFHNKVITKIHIKQLSFINCVKVLTDNQFVLNNKDITNKQTNNEYIKRLIKKTSI